MADKCSHHAPRDDRGAGGSPAFVQASRLYHEKITASPRDVSPQANVARRIEEEKPLFGEDAADEFACGETSRGA